MYTLPGILSQERILEMYIKILDSRRILKLSHTTKTQGKSRICSRWLILSPLGFAKCIHLDKQLA